MYVAYVQNMKKLHIPFVTVKVMDGMCSLR